MLSYRHAFHAGNHADVLKHVVLLQLLDHLATKEKGFLVVDTHAGAGRYALDGKHAQQNKEYETGISQLWQAPDLPAALRDYVEIVKSFNSNGELKTYPGSPIWIAEKLREQDQLVCFELHPSDYEAFEKNFSQQKKRDARIQVKKEDGLKGLKSVLPPPSRRGLVFIDPAYENFSEFDAVETAVVSALKRFSTGIYAIWYPLVKKFDVGHWLDRFKLLPGSVWLDICFSVCVAPKDGLGLYGSGLLVMNPPWKLAETLREVMPCLVELLGQDRHATFKLLTS